MVFSELVSRNTRYSGRVLISLSVAVLLSFYLSIDLTDLDFFGIIFNRSQVESILYVLISISFFVHVINWTGDFLSLKNWVIGLKESEIELFYGGRTSLVSKLNIYLVDWDNLKANFEKENMETFREQLVLLTEETRRLQASIVSFLSFSWFYIVVFQLLIPIALSGWAIFVVYHG